MACLYHQQYLSNHHSTKIKIHREFKVHTWIKEETLNNLQLITKIHFSETNHQKMRKRRGLSRGRRNMLNSCNNRSQWNNNINKLYLKRGEEQVNQSHSNIAPICHYLNIHISNHLKFHMEIKGLLRKMFLSIQWQCKIKDLCHLNKWLKWCQDHLGRWWIIKCLSNRI